MKDCRGKYELNLLYVCLGKVVYEPKTTSRPVRRRWPTRTH